VTSLQLQNICTLIFVHFFTNPCQTSAVHLQLIGYDGILKQKLGTSNEQLIRFPFGLWHGPQQKYSTIKKETLAIVLCISKFQDDLFIKNFLLRIDCKSAKEVLQKAVQNLVSKQIFARWQAISSAFALTLNLSKEKAILFLIFLQENSCKERVTQTFLGREK